MSIYLDNNATTPVDPRVLALIQEVMATCWGNPSSIHRDAQRAREHLENARGVVAKHLGLSKPSQIIWTSGGTESNTTVLWGSYRLARLAEQKGAIPRKKLVISSGEHASIMKTSRAMKEEWGIELVEIPLDNEGLPRMDALERAVDENTFLVSIMTANNETGVVFPIDKIGQLCRTRGVRFHTDAVNALGKVDIDFGKLAFDYLSLGAHKLHGPKGVGALVLGMNNGRPAEFLPLFYGGSQERARRAGTENVPLIAGFAEAVRLCAENKLDYIKRMGELRDRYEKAVTSACSDVRVLGSKAPRTANTSTLCFKGISAHSLLVSMDLDGVCLSSGSACSSGSVEPSHVLSAMGLSKDDAQSTVRMSVSRLTTDKEIDEAVMKLVGNVQRLRTSDHHEAGL
jgi:cysteine desulfurase